MIELFGMRRAVNLKAASTTAPSKPPAAPGDSRPQVSARDLRREAASAAADATHTKEIAKRFSLLRTRLLREMRNRGWRRLAVVPVSRGAGGTFTSVNLALALARQSQTQVILVDLDLGNPGVADQLGVPGRGLVGATLMRGQPLEQMVGRLSEAPNLAFLAPGAPEPGAAELLQDHSFVTELERLTESHPAELAILDFAPLLGDDTALAALPLADAILLVADGRRTTAAHMQECERLLVGLPPVIGVILNKSED